MDLFFQQLLRSSLQHACGAHSGQHQCMASLQITCCACPSGPGPCAGALRPAPAAAVNPHAGSSAAGRRFGSARLPARAPPAVSTAAVAAPAFLARSPRPAAPALPDSTGAIGSQNLLARAASLAKVNSADGAQLWDLSNEVPHHLASAPTAPQRLQLPGEESAAHPLRDSQEAAGEVTAPAGGASTHQCPSVSSSQAVPAPVGGSGTSEDAAASLKERLESSAGASTSGVAARTRGPAAGARAPPPPQRGASPPRPRRAPRAPERPLHLQPLQGWHAAEAPPRPPGYGRALYTQIRAVTHWRALMALAGGSRSGLTLFHVSALLHRLAELGSGVVERAAAGRAAAAEARELQLLVQRLLSLSETRLQVYAAAAGRAAAAAGHATAAAGVPAAGGLAHLPPRSPARSAGKQRLSNAGGDSGAESPTIDSNGAVNGDAGQPSASGSTSSGSKSSRGRSKSAQPPPIGRASSVPARAGRADGTAAHPPPAPARLASEQRSPFPPSVLADLLWSLARLQAAPPPGWLATLMSASLACGCLAKATPPQLAKLLWALGQLRPPLPAAWESELMTAYRRCLAAGMQPGAVALATMGARDAGCQPSPAALNDACGAIAAAAPAMNATDVSGCLYALSDWLAADGGGSAAVDAAPAARLSPVAREALAALLARGEAVMASATPSETATMLWAAAKLGHRPPSGFLSAFQQASYAAMPSADGCTLANLGWAVARLQLRFRCAFCSSVGELIWIMLCGRACRRAAAPAVLRYLPSCLKHLNVLSLAN